LSSIPDKDLLSEALKRNSTSEFDQIFRAYASHHEIRFFSGERVFSSVRSEDLVRDYYLKNDPHWNDLGSTRYAMKMADFIKSGDRVGPDTAP
jgi:hypothetical protein